MWSRSRVAIASTAAAASVAALVVVATDRSGSGSAVHVTRGEVGGEPSMPYGRDAPEADIGIHYETRPTVLAAGRAPDDAPRASRLPAEPSGTVGPLHRRHLPRTRRGARLRQRLRAGPGHLLRSRPSHASGGLDPANTEKVLVHYTVDGRTAASEAALVHVDDPDVIERIRVDRPFGFYLAILPEGAKNIVAEGLNEDGRFQWRAVFYPPPDYSRRKPPDFQGRSNLRG
jgi:hypothetical protein